MKRQTSLEAFQKIKDEGLLGKQASEIYGVLFESGPLTTRQVHERVSETIRDIGQVSTGISKLVQKGVLRDCGTTKCATTGFEVTQWDVTDRLPIKVEKPQREKCKQCGGKGYVTTAQTSLPI